MTDSFKILSLNVGQMPFPLGLDSRDKRLKLLIDTILSNEDLDVLCFQELFRKEARISIVNKLKDEYPYYLVDSSSGKYYIGVNSGLAIFSKYPIIDTIKHTYKHFRGVENFAKKGLLGVKIKITDMFINIFNTHLQSGIGSEPCVCKIFDYFSDSPGSNMSSTELKIAQVEELAHEIEVFCYETEKVVSVGDFNILTRKSDYVSLKDIMESIELFDTFSSDDSPLQSSVIGENKRIDYVWSDIEGYSIITNKYGNSKITDHRDVIAYLNL